MLRWQGLDDVPTTWGPSLVTVGVFDGVHRGHQAIITTAVGRAHELGVPAVVVTFHPHPMDVVRPGNEPPMLTTLERRAELIASLGAAACLVLPFTEEMARQSAEEFVAEVLVGRLHAVEVVVGENFRFGHRAAGSVATLHELGAAAGFEAQGVPLLLEGDPVSSTAIRQAIAAGDAEAATTMLGRPHRVEGVVVTGDKRGRLLGYPTANLDCPPRTAVPADGVYAGYLVRASGERLVAAVSVGTNPTFDGVSRRVEAYVLGRHDYDFYGERVAVEVVRRLRPTLRFDGVEPLVAQMALDVAQVRELLT